MDTANIIILLNHKLTKARDTVPLSLDESFTPEEKQFIIEHAIDSTLIVYGSLAPGKSNHHIIQHINGKWISGVVAGKLLNAGWESSEGYPVYLPSGSDHTGHI